MSRPILIIGAGGHARVVASVLSHLGDWDIAGVLDRTDIHRGEAVHCTRIVGAIHDLDDWRQRGVHYLALAIGDNAERRDLYGALRDRGFELPTLVHPSARLEPGAQVGPGTLVCCQAVLGVEVVVGENSIVNTGTIVDHESVVGPHSHLAPGCVIAGRVRIGEGAFLGIGATVRDKVSIGARSTIGAGAVVVVDIPPDVLAYGVPARVMRSTK